MKIGDVIHVRACKTDGATYRSWRATIESVTTDSIVTIAPAGSMVSNVNSEDMPLVHHYRAYYWHDRYYNLIEVFDISGKLIQIYINVASPPEFDADGMSFKDHELDVSRRLPGRAKLVDEDEFAEAVIKYNYSQEFQKKMYAVARETLELAETWQAGPCPEFGEKS